MKFLTKMYRFLITFCRRRTTKYISRLTYFTFSRIQEKTWKSIENGHPKVIKKHPKGSPGAFRKSSKKSYPKKMKKVAGNRPKMKKLGSKMASEIFEKRPRGVRSSPGVVQGARFWAEGPKDEPNYQRNRINRLLMILTRPGADGPANLLFFVFNFNCLIWYYIAQLEPRFSCRVAAARKSWLVWH